MTILRFSDGLKGGTGKSTVAIALVDYLVLQGNVLLIDADKTNPDFSRQFEKTVLPITIMRADLTNDDGWDDFMGTIEDYAGQFKNIVISMPAGETESRINLNIIQEVFKDLNIEVWQYFTVNRSAESVAQYIKSGESGFGSIADKRIVVLNGYSGVREKFTRWDIFFELEEKNGVTHNHMYFPDLNDDLMDFLKENKLEQSFEEISVNASMRLFARSKIKEWIKEYKTSFEGVE